MGPVDLNAVAYVVRTRAIGEEGIHIDADLLDKDVGVDITHSKLTISYGTSLM